MLHNLRTDRRIRPLGIDSARPELSWEKEPDDADGYEIQACTTPGFADPLWTARARTCAVPRVDFPEPLASRQRIWWRVRDLAEGQKAGEWSEPTWFETGLLEPADWAAGWVTGGTPATPETLYFRGTVTVPPGVVRARAYVSALGWYRLFVNGIDQTGPDLVPRWTPFDDCIEYQVYDIADAVREGAITVGVVVSEGRFRGKLGGLSLANRYGDRLAVIAQFEFALADGTVVRSGSDASWTVGRGRIRHSDPKHGETVDLRIPDDWHRPGPRDGEVPVESAAPHRRALIAEEVERVTRTATLRGRVSRTPSGAWLVDFGQNFAGVAAVRLTGEPGDEVTLAYGEVLTPAGELDTTYLGNKKGSAWFQTDRVTLAGGTEVYTPWFTIHGFRYLVVTGLRGELSAGDVEGIVVTTNLSETGHFSCSDRRLERLHENVRWSMRSNFTDTPSDCPTRERSGWTGDIQVFGPTAMILADTNSYLRRYLRNVAVEQLPDGRVPVFVPAEASEFSYGMVERLFAFQSTAAGWGDVAVLLPWEMYRRYADETGLRRAYPAARAWVDGMARRAATKRHITRRFRGIGRDERYLVDTGFHYGEWLRPAEELGTALLGNLVRPPAEVATAYLAHSAAVLSRIASVLEEHADHEKYTQLAVDTRRAWQTAFVSAGGSRIGADKQDDYVRALGFDLLPESQRAAALNRLVELIELADGRLGTGFLSTSMLLGGLSRNGRSDIAHRVLFRATAPSWLAQIGLGATTIWETWEGYRADGSATRSHNHYALGAVAQWLHEDLAGLRPAAPGYRRMTVDPVLFPDLESAGTSVATPYGRAECAWARDGDTVTVTFSLPRGTEADVMTDDGVRVFGPGQHSVTRHRTDRNPAPDTAPAGPGTGAPADGNK